MDYFLFRRTHVGVKSFQGKINLSWNPTESRIPAGIPEGRTHDMVFCATCNEHSLIRHEKRRGHRWHCAAVTAPRRKPLCHAAATAATEVAAELARRPAVAAAAAAAAQSSSLFFPNPPPLHFLLVGIVLPLFVARCSFRRPPPARLRRTMVGCCLVLSTALFVVPAVQ